MAFVSAVVSFLRRNAKNHRRLYRRFEQDISNLNMEYNEFLQGINSGKINKLVFSVNGYSHYKECVIESKIIHFGDNSQIRVIDVLLTRDHAERVCFFEKYNEKYKLFKFKNKGGRVTLKDVWERLSIIKIE